ncbi:SEC23-interacting protein [Anguilla anguilla]|uniref:SEC23-interacting protein n=1 Tax=Anguilla anguilla TaxID=7936 RepID=UPI0015ABE00B|nr:SEC23-interacting protein [Anguilla anguilla]
MAEKKNNSSSSTNLLFSTAPQLNFNLPFIPVSQACGPAVLSGDDSADVGEEDSFLGQSSGVAPQPSTLNYFSSPANSNDPFASIGARPAPPVSQFSPAVTVPACAPSVPNAAPLASVPQSAPVSQFLNSQQSPPASQFLNAQQCPPVSQFGTAVFQSAPPGCTPPLSAASAQTPPPQGYNPYRHTPVSSRANPYLAPPELQQHHVPLQHAAFPPQAPPSAAPAFSQPGMPPLTQGPPSIAGPLVPAPPTIPYTYAVYEPVQPHWFFCRHVESKNIWLPFSVLDSVQLEETFNSVQPDPESVVVRTDGGRYDVQLYDRLRSAVFWEEEPSEVRRCTWFYKGDTDSRFIPYSEEFSDKLEGEYKKAVFTNQWHRRLEFPTGETIVMHNPKVIVQFQPSAVPDEWGTTQDGQTRPRVVKRGIDDDHDEIPDGELPQADHLVFMVHGIGPVCDLRFRTMVECVDDFRSVSLKLLQSHFHKAQEEQLVSRVEFLPVQWHTALHGDATGVDRRIKKITLPSTGRLRHFTNETLLDVLFYNSPTYCQTIMDKVALEINRLHALFMERNPEFTGGISVAGHSLGSLILFDLLSNQKTAFPSHVPAPSEQKPVEEKQAASSVSQTNGTAGQPVVEEAAGEEEEEFPNLTAVLEHLSLTDYLSTLEKEQIDMESLLMCTVDDLKEMGIPLGPRKKIAKFVKERASKQEKAAQRALVAPPAPQAPLTQSEPTPPPSSSQSEPTPKILSVSGAVSSVHVDYNYFEVGTGQVSVVYHTLDFHPVNFFALGSPIGMFLTVRGLERIEETYQLPTCRGFFNIYHPLDPVAYRIEPLIVPDLELKPVLIPHHKGRKRLHLELKESLTRMGSDLKQGFLSSLKTAWQTLNDFARAHTSSPQLQAELEKVANQIKEEEEKQEVAVDKLVESPDSSKEEDPLVKIGMLNGGRRIDYVLQEKPIESFNEYLFALQSHLCYWESEDTALLILKEIYKTMGIYPEQTH